MTHQEIVRRTFQEFDQAIYLTSVAEAFLLDRRASRASKGTLKFYKTKLARFVEWCDGRQIKSILEVTPGELRLFFLWLEETGHNPGGIHAFYRTVKVFFRWFEAEFEPENWKNPIRKIKAPKVPEKILEPETRESVLRIVGTCQAGNFKDSRDAALILLLFDTGARATEALSLNFEDIDFVTGEISIKFGKGGKVRSAFLGRTTRKALRKYLKFFGNSQDRDPVFQNGSGGRLTYSGLRSILQRRSEVAGIPNITAHSLRRGFAISMLRAGVDLITLQRLMGHSNLTVLQRYLKQLPEDLQAAHRRASPVDWS